MNWKVTIRGLCDKVLMTRQNYYKARKRRQRREVDGRQVEALVRDERRLQPRLGGRKLFHLPAAKLAEHGIPLGRDRFFEVLRERGLLVEKLPSFMPQTTNSRHRLPVVHNH